MAKFELKFIDCLEKNSYIKVISGKENGEQELKTPVIKISGFDIGYDSEFSIWLDKSTAIKFAKTLRTEINKITESEVSNE